MLAFRSLDPFRALREPDRRRRDEERLSRSEQRTLSKTQNNHLTGKAPYKFESVFLQLRLPPAESPALARSHFRRSRTPAFRAGVRLIGQPRAAAAETPAGSVVSSSVFGSKIAPWQSPTDRN